VVAIDFCCGCFVVSNQVYSQTLSSFLRLQFSYAVMRGMQSNFVAASPPGMWAMFFQSEEERKSILYVMLAAKLIFWIDAQKGPCCSLLDVVTRTFEATLNPTKTECKENKPGETWADAVWSQIKAWQLNFQQPERSLMIEAWLSQFCDMLTEMQKRIHRDLKIWNTGTARLQKKKSQVNVKKHQVTHTQINIHLKGETSSRQQQLKSFPTELIKATCIQISNGSKTCKRWGISTWWKNTDFH